MRRVKEKGTEAYGEEGHEVKLPTQSRAFDGPHRICRAVAKKRQSKKKTESGPPPQCPWTIGSPYTTRMNHTGFLLRNLSITHGDIYIFFNSFTRHTPLPANNAKKSDKKERTKEGEE